MNALSLIQATVEPGQGRLRLCTIEFPLNPGRAPQHEETEQEKESREWHEWDSAVAMGKELAAVFKANHVSVLYKTDADCEDDVWVFNIEVKAVSPKTMVTALVSGIDKLYRTWQGRAFHGDRYTEHKINVAQLTHDLTHGSDRYVTATVEAGRSWRKEAKRAVRAAGLSVAHEWDVTGEYPEGMNVDGHIRIITPNFPHGKDVEVRISVKTDSLNVWVNDNLSLLRKTDNAPKLLPKILVAIKSLTTTRTLDVIKALETAAK